VPWFQVDDDLPTHPDMLAVSLAARGLWVTAGAWCAKRLTDAVPDHVLASLGSTPELEQELGAQGVWKRARKGWRFTQNGLCKIPVKETVDHQRELKTLRQKRWRANQGRRDVDASTDPSTSPPITSTNKEPPNPPPSGGHDGSHPNCRACGTNPRGKPPEPKPTPTPPAFDDVHHVNGSPARGDAVAAAAARARAGMRGT
jgi:hypothetical protein